MDASDVIANFISIFFVILFFKSFLEAYYDPKKHINSPMYFFGYDNETECKTSNHRIAITVPTIKQETKAKVKHKPEANDLEELKRECDLAMKAIGADSKQRKYLLRIVFQEHSPKTVEEFLRKAFV